MIKQTSTGLPVGTYGAVTAGTTQTQAGATATTTSNVAVTTGNASDGVALPRADKACHVGGEVLVQNLSAVALKVYPYYDTTDGASGGTIGAGGANAAFAHAASTTRKYVCTAINTWQSILT